MKVTYTVPSSYTISIPSSITVGESAIVAASNVVLHEDGALSVGESETLSVSVSSEQYSNGWQLKNGDNSIPYTIQNGDQSISNNSTVLTATNGQSPSVTLTTALAETTKPLSYAGNYMDTLVFSVKLTSGIDLSSLTGTYVINDSKTYTFTGTGNHGIRVNTGSGNPTIKLVNAQINVSGAPENAIDVVGGNATIHVTGNSTVQAEHGAGIHVAEGQTVTITGNSRKDQLTATSKLDGAGIGGYRDQTYGKNIACGNIMITNVQVSAQGSRSNITNTMSAGIGGCDTASCGTITIDNATVYAYGAFESNSSYYYYAVGAPAIGAGCHHDSSGALTHGSFGSIIIQNGSEVYASRGSEHSDYIGYCGNQFYPASKQLIGDTEKISYDSTCTVEKKN